uniref:Carboxypeptidase n=1 Tax=Kalanchoe fedtschenkoi TaxID=63787 RepID=A0A7N0ZX43_KALFE
MAFTLVHKAVLVTLLALFITVCCATTHSAADYAMQQAERLVNSFNLSPKRPVNIIHDEAVKPAGLVERRFTFPGLADPSSNASVADLGHHAGYYPIKHSYDAKMFYFFFESRVSKADPVVIWLTGGPGCSSSVALFYENGPFKINDDLTLRWNDYGWDMASNILFVDQPTGTGFSYSSDERDLRHDETGVSNDLYDFLQAFFQGHPEFASNDFYVTGESYAGHYVPALASRINKGNKNKEGIHINLKGFAIGNGLTDPEHQYPAYTDFALANSLITQSDYARINEMVPECVREIQQCQTEEPACGYAYSTCNEIFESILAIAGNINYYDIRKQCVGELCYDFSNVEKFLNLDTVREALGVGDIEFVSCSKTVYYAMLDDWMKDYEEVIPLLLEEGIKVLIYAGEYDLICNWMGNSIWVNVMPWSGQQSFVSANVSSYIVGGKEVGLVKSFGPLTFLKVHNAGHMVPMDQPNVSLQMIKGWMSSSKGKVPAGKSKILP